MAVSVTKDAEAYLEALAGELAISDARYQQADESYASFGRWLHRDTSSIRQYNPQVYVQGSFRLGTAIRPLTEQEDYDVDSVCDFALLNPTQLSQKKLKELLEVEVRSYHRAKNMTNPVREGRRCWILDYADGAQFHMDIVPAVPNAVRARALLESAGHTVTWAATAIGITDNERHDYAYISIDWPRSNPKGYCEWFRLRMGSIFEERRRILAESIRASIESIPIYRVRTPLQAAIMILKRHRDFRFRTRPDDKPISIILTTLAAHAYNGERSIGLALVSILTNMERFIGRDASGRYVIANPTDPLENFADKWVDHPQRARAFFEWLNQARRDFTQIAQAADMQTLTENTVPALGRSLAERTAKRSTSPAGGMARVASVAPAGVSFSNEPRVPTEPKGFA
jgi:hypothetical protein